MGSQDFVEQVSGVASLADPVRRKLYLWVAGQPHPASRDLAAESLDLPRHTVKFHLDKLVEQGLLDVTFERLTGRRGPGAGRPTKLYRRSAQQVTVTLPERRYDLAGQLLAGSIEQSTTTGTPVLDALQAAAGRLGRQLGDLVHEVRGADSSPERRIAVACSTLATQGYEPRRNRDTITLVNCPFDALAREHTKLICGMNLALLEGFASRLGNDIRARLEPAEGRCCVVMYPAPEI